MFTKEDKDNNHFIEVRDHILADKQPNFDIQDNEIARRALSVSYASTTLLHVSEGGISTYVQTDTSTLLYSTRVINLDFIFPLCTCCWYGTWYGTMVHKVSAGSM